MKQKSCSSKDHKHRMNRKVYLRSSKHADCNDVLCLYNALLACPNGKSFVLLPFCQPLMRFVLWFVLLRLRKKKVYIHTYIPIPVKIQGPPLVAFISMTGLYRHAVRCITA